MKTTLEAVNDVLRRLNKMPVASLGLGPLATRIQRVIEDEERALQRQGWHFNTKYNVSMSPNNDSKYDVTSLETTEVFAVDTYGTDFSKNLVRQGNFLYDLDENTDTFTGDIKVSYSFQLPFESIPEAFQDWVIARSSFRIATSEGAEQSELNLLNLEVNRAEAFAKRDEFRRSDVNVLETYEAVQIRGRRRLAVRSVE